LVLFFKKELLPSYMSLIRDIRDIGTQQTAKTAPFYTFQPVAEPASVPQSPPPFLLGPATAGVLWDIFADIETPAAGCYAIENVVMAPTGFPIKDGVALHGTAFLHPRHHVVTVSDRLNAADLPMRDVAGPLAVICGPAHETWGHWLIDFLPRLWVLRAAGFAALRRQAAALFRHLPGPVRDLRLLARNHPLRPRSAADRLAGGEPVCHLFRGGDIVVDRRHAARGARFRCGFAKIVSVAFGRAAGAADGEPYGDRGGRAGGRLSLRSARGIVRGRAGRFVFASPRAGGRIRVRAA
jgi:hypothetical protein